MPVADGVDPVKGGVETNVGKCYRPGCLRRAALKCGRCLQVQNDVVPIGKGNITAEQFCFNEKRRQIPRVFVKLGALKVRYCSGKCQELAWGQHHWEECVQVTLFATFNSNLLDDKLFSACSRESACGPQCGVRSGAEST